MNPAEDKTDKTAELAAEVIRLARENRRVIATAESCTGGLVSAALTDTPGSSSVFAGGVTAYRDSVKIGMLDVPEDALERHSAVSSQVAVLMAQGAAVRLDADLTVATTGYAGPGGGTAERPSGTVYVAVHDGEFSKSTVMRYRFHGDRAQVRRLAVRAALEGLRAAMARDRS